MSLIVSAFYIVSLSYVSSVGLARDGDSSITLLLWTPVFSKLLVAILDAIGDGFFLGVASTDIESESLVNRGLRLVGLPLAPPYLPSLFLFSKCSLFLMT